MGWRERYEAIGTEEIVRRPSAPTVNVARREEHAGA